MATSAALPTDGRTQRAERSREAIVDAMLALIGEGEPSPTAQQVAARAEVGVRTVFRHFSDMESLFGAMNERLTAETAPRFFVDDVQDGALEARIEQLIDRRCELLEHLAPYAAASALQRPHSPFLREQSQRDVRRLRNDLLRWLPELEAAEPAVADAFEMLLSFEAWRRLRVDQRLGLRRARAATEAAIRALLPGLGGTASSRSTRAARPDGGARSQRGSR